MTLTAGLQSGLVSGLQTGLNAGVATQLLATDLTPSLVASILGEAAPTHMWLLNEASGATDLVGSSDLTEVGTPTREYSDAVLGCVGTEFTMGGTDSLIASTSADGDVGAETVTTMVICRLTDNANGGTKNIFGNRSSTSPYNGFQLAARLGYIRWTIDSPDSNPIREVAVDHTTTQPLVLLATRSVAGGNSGLWTPEGSQDSTAGVTGSTLTNDKPVSIGDDSFGVSAGVVVAAVMQWIGTDGDFSDFAAAQAAMEAALGFP